MVLNSAHFETQRNVCQHCEPKKQAATLSPSVVEWGGFNTRNIWLLAVLFSGEKSPILTTSHPHSNQLLGDRWKKKKVPVLSISEYPHKNALVISIPKLSLVEAVLQLGYWTSGAVYSNQVSTSRSLVGPALSIVASTPGLCQGSLSWKPGLYLEKSLRVELASMFETKGTILTLADTPHQFSHSHVDLGRQAYVCGLA